MTGHAVGQGEYIYWAIVKASRPKQLQPIADLVNDLQWLREIKFFFFEF